MTVALYRHYDADGRLLYVGISGNLSARDSQHFAGSEWMQRTCRSTTEWLETRDAAIIAERKAIISERPIFNTALKSRNQASEIINLIGQSRLAKALDVGVTAVNNAAARGKMPASWLRVVEYFAEIDGFDLCDAEELFGLKPAPSPITPFSVNSGRGA